MENFRFFAIPTLVLLFSNLSAPTYPFSTCTFSAEKAFDVGKFERDCVDASLQGLSTDEKERALDGQSLYLAGLGAEVEARRSIGSPLSAADTKILANIKAAQDVLSKKLSAVRTSVVQRSIQDYQAYNKRAEAEEQMKEGQRQAAERQKANMLKAERIGEQVSSLMKSFDNGPWNVHFEKWSGGVVVLGKTLPRYPKLQAI